MHSCVLLIRACFGSLPVPQGSEQSVAGAGHRACCVPQLLGALCLCHFICLGLALVVPCSSFPFKQSKFAGGLCAPQTPSYTITLVGFWRIGKSNFGFNH